MRFLLLLGPMLATACASQVSPTEVMVEPTIAPEEVSVETEGVFLPNLGPAPELQNEVWLNTDQPLRLAELRGKVVLLDMWTFG